MIDVQIFMSYARVDDAPPPHLPDAKGFVTFLHEQLAFELRRIGAPWPKIWRDTKRIENADQFEPRIERAISDSSILLVVLSKNWISRPYCVSELESFAERWKADGGLRERIVVAAKREVDPDRRPSLLQGQVGIKFYALDEPEESEGGAGLEQEFYAGGRIRDRRYEDRNRRAGRNPVAQSQPETPAHENQVNFATPRRNRTAASGWCAPTAGPSSSQSPPMTCTRRMIA